MLVCQIGSFKLKLEVEIPTDNEICFVRMNLDDTIARSTYNRLDGQKSQYKLTEDLCILPFILSNGSKYVRLDITIMKTSVSKHSSALTHLQFIFHLDKYSATDTAARLFNRTRDKFAYESMRWDNNDYQDEQLIEHQTRELLKKLSKERRDEILKTFILPYAVGVTEVPAEPKPEVEVEA